MEFLGELYDTVITILFILFLGLIFKIATDDK